MNNCAYTKLHARHYVHNGLAPAKWDYHKLHQKHMESKCGTCQWLPYETTRLYVL